MDSGMSEFSVGRSPAAGGGRSMFSQTCNLLSQYLKENGAFGDLSLGMSGAVGKARSTMNLLPLMEKSKDHGASSEPETAQMTIFYGGQVLVFNDLSAEKAKEIMLLANSCSNSVACSPGVSPTFSNINLPREQPPHPIPSAFDLPIARNASLQRFLAKRKDRIAARSPYGMMRNSPASSKSGGDGEAWLQLAARQSSKVGDFDQRNVQAIYPFSAIKL